MEQLNNSLSNTPRALEVCEAKEQGWSEEVGSAGEHLLCRCQVLGPVPGTAKKKKERSEERNLVSLGCQCPRPYRSENCCKEIMTSGYTCHCISLRCGSTKSLSSPIPANGVTKIVLVLRSSLVCLRLLQVRSPDPWSHIWPLIHGDAISFCEKCIQIRENPEQNKLQ